MANTSTQKYTSTINGQIARISAATALLAGKVADWELKIPTTTDEVPTTVATGTADLTASSHIEDVAAAINLINKKISTNTATTADLSFSGKTASGSYTIKKGYYPNDLVVSFTGDMANAVFNTSIYNASTNAKGVVMKSESTATVQNTTAGYAASDLTVSLPTGAYGTSEGTMTALDKVKISRTTTGYAPGEVTATIPLGAYNITTTNTSGKTDAVTISGGNAVITRTGLGYAPASISATLPVTSTLPTLSKNANNKLTITPTAGYYNGTALTTTIAYNPTNTITVNVSTDTETATTTYETATIKAGYYSADLSVNIKFNTETTTGKRINVLSTKAVSPTDYTPDTGYDYLKQVTVANAGTFGITDTTNTLTVGTYDSTNKYYPVTQANGLVGTVTTAGWTGTTVGTDSSVKVGTIAKATITASATGGSKEIAAPALDKYITDGTNGGHPALLTDDAISTTEPTSGFWVAMKSNANTTGQTISVTPKYTVTGSGYITKDSTADGTAVDAKVTLAAGDAHYVKLQEATVAGSGTKTASAPTIKQGAASTTNTNRISSTPSTTVPASGYYVAIQATAPATTGIAFTLTSATEGYVKLAAGASLGTASTTAKTGSVYYAPIAAGTHTIGNLLKADNAIGDYVAKDHYYVKCDTTTGFLEASTTYIDLGTEGTGGVLNRSTTSKTINAGTYYPIQLQVSVSYASGILRDTARANETNSNITSSDTTATTVSTARLDTLTADTTFYATGDGTNKRFLTSFKVEVTDIIQALQAI